MDGSRIFNIALSGLNATDIPAPGIGIARCLKEVQNFKVKIIGLAYDVFEPGILDNNLIDCTYLMPYPKLGKESLLRRIIEINNKEKIDVIIPSLDSELLNYIRIKDELNKTGIKLFLPSEKQFSKITKINLPLFCENTGLKTPKTKIATSMSEINAEHERYPLLVKGAIYEAYIAHNSYEFTHYVHKIVNKWGFPIIIQEIVNGEEINVVCLGDGEGNTIGYTCMRKMVTSSMGKGWTCMSIENERVIDIARRIVSFLKWVGAIEIEGIFSKRDNEYYILEFNPRFPQWIYLAKEAGVNLPYMYTKLAMGEKVKEKTNFISGKIFTNYTTNIVTDLSRIESLLTLGETQNEKSIPETISKTTK